MPKKKLTFEELLLELDEIVVKLEEGDVPLEEAMAYFKKGMELSKSCHSILELAEEEMSSIVGEDGVVRPFSVEGDGV